MREDKRRFLYHVKEDPHLRFWLFDSEWSEYSSAQVSEQLISDTKAAIATYPSGEVLCNFGSIRDLPSDIHFMNGPVYRDGSDGYKKSLINNSKGGAKVSHGRSRSQEGDPRYYYSTSIKNLSHLKIRVVKFAPFIRRWFRIVADPHMGYYSPLQFSEWFRVQDEDGWIAPGETVKDPDNYGSGKGVWAFIFEREDGVRFIATAPLEYQM